MGLFTNTYNPPIVLAQTSQDDPGPLDNSSQAAATAGGRLETPAEPRAADEDLVLAAHHCVALDGSGYFPADHSLGLFEMGGARASTPRIASASVEFVPQRRREEGRGGVERAVAAGTVGVRLLFEVDTTNESSTDERRKEEGVGISAHDLDAAYLYEAGESIPTREEVETAAAEAAAVTNNAAEAHLAISALAAWNVAANTGLAQEGTAAGMDIRVEVAAAFGYRGDRYTSSKSVGLAQDERGVGSNAIPLSASFDWQPTEDVWASLDGPAVADVKVFGAPSSAMVESSSAKQGELLLLQATLCKRASPGAATGTAKRAATASMEATLGPYIEQSEYAKLAADATRPSSQSLVIVTEIEDQEWWKAREKEEYGRGMAAVNALPRVPGWKPGDWEKRRRRKRRQEEEREKRRTEKANRRRAGRRGGEGVSGTGSRGMSKNRRRKSGWGVVKGAWRAVGRMLRGATGKLRRKE